MCSGTPWPFPEKEHPSWASGSGSFCYHTWLWMLAQQPGGHVHGHVCPRGCRTLSDPNLDILKLGLVTAGIKQARGSNSEARPVHGTETPAQAAWGQPPQTVPPLLHADGTRRQHLFVSLLHSLSRCLVSFSLHPGSRCDDRFRHPTGSSQVISVTETTGRERSGRERRASGSR